MPKLLIVEDDHDVCDFLHDELTDAGFTVTKVNSGADAIVAAAEESFDLVLLDMLMPGLNGSQTIRLRGARLHGPGRSLRRPLLQQADQNGRSDRRNQRSAKPETRSVKMGAYRTWGNTINQPRTLRPSPWYYVPRTKCSGQVS